MTTTPSPAPRKRAPGAGRKPLEGGIVRVNMTLTPAHAAQLKALGGSAWVRKMLDAVRVHRARGAQSARRRVHMAD